MNDYSIIIDCPDSYLDILTVFFVYLEKNWSSRKQKIFITTQTSEIPHPHNVVFVKCGDNTNSIQRTKTAINLVDDKYILIMDCDDFIQKKVDEQYISDLLSYAENNDIKYIRVWRTKNMEQRKYPTSFKHLFYCNKKARYSKSLMANFWDKSEYLKVFQSDDANGWSIEAQWLEETYNSNVGFYESYCYCSSDPFHILHAISKGKWIRKAYKYLIKTKVSKNLLSQRKKLSFRDNLKLEASDILKNILPSRICLWLKRRTKKVVNYTSDY